MGMNSYFYVGSYLLVPKVEQVDTKVTYACSNPKCGNKKVDRNDKFCSKCGTAVAKIENPVTTLEHLHCCEVDDEFEDDFWTPESGYGNKYALWLPNSNKIGQTFDDGGTEADDLKPLKADDIDKSLAQFRSKYSKLLDKLEALGAKPVVQFGPVVYWC